MSEGIFLCTLPFLSGLKCLLMDGISRKAKGGSREQHKAFMHACFHLETTWALGNPGIGDWFQMPLHLASSLPSLTFPAPPKSLKPLTHPSFLQTFQQELTGGCAGSIPGCSRPPSLPWKPGWSLLGCLGSSHSGLALGWGASSSTSLSFGCWTNLWVRSPGSEANALLSVYRYMS